MATPSRRTVLRHKILVICCRPGKAETAMAQMRTLMTRIGLEVNETKTRIALQRHIALRLRGNFRHLTRSTGQATHWDLSETSSKGSKATSSIPRLSRRPAGADERRLTRSRSTVSAYRLAEFSR
jgi:hypothetical protein